MNRTELTAGQRERLYATLAYIDARLDEAERRLAPAETRRAFASHVADGTPLQATIVRDYAARVRATMGAALKRHGLTLPAPRASAVGSARAHLRAAAIAAEELAPRHLRGYGPVSDELARELNLTSAALVELLDDLDRHLARGPERELPDDAWRGLLAELQRVVGAHALSELRGALDALVDRLQAPRLEIAVFGRVNSGKSSLLNRVLGRNALPVGIAPTTAVPTRIVYGARAEATAWFVDAQTENFDLARLAEFADARQNPDNVRHVTRLQIALPAPMLKPGVAFIDTPGYGALGAVDAPDPAFGCDIGIVLLDASSAPTAADAAVVDSLACAGAHTIVVLAKADLLSAEEGVLALSHAQGALYAATGSLVPVHLVSVKGAAAKLCDAWLDNVLAPCLRERQLHIERSIAHRVDRLRAEAIAALERRLAVANMGDVPTERQHVPAALAEALAAFDRLRGEPATAFGKADGAARQVIARAAHNAAVIWCADYAPSIDVAPIVAAALEGCALSAANALERRIIAARAALANALETARDALVDPPAIDELPRLPAAPPMNAAALIRSTAIARGAALPIGALLAFVVRRRLHRLGLAATIAAALAGYDRALDAWRTAALDAIRQHFARQAERVGVRRGVAAAEMRADLERLRAFGAQPPVAAPSSRAENGASLP